MPGKGAVDEIRAWGRQEKSVMGEGDERHDRRIRASIGFASVLTAINAMSSAGSAKPGLLR
jgi:hypothetical protein